MRMRRYLFLLLAFLLGFTVDDVQKEFITLNWYFVDHPDGGKFENASLDNAVFPDVNSVPVFTKIYPLKSVSQSFRVVVENPVFEEITDEVNFPDAGVTDKIKVETAVLKSGSVGKLQVRIFPIVKKDGRNLRLTRFELKRIPVTAKSAKTDRHPWESSSVLKSGKWIKISTSEKGIHKITYSKLNEWGFSNPAQVNVFGSGGVSLSENPAEINYDDLPQVAVWHAKSNGENCLFFYEPGTTGWKVNFNGENFTHKLNDYSTRGYFFLTENAGQPKLAEMLPEINGQANRFISAFDDYQLYEPEQYNLLIGGSGKQWFGDKFANNSTKSFSFDLSGVVIPSEVTVKINTAGRSSSPSEMPVTINQKNLGKINFSAVNTGESDVLFADESDVTFKTAVQQEKLNVVVKYSADNSNAEAWLDFIELNYKRKLALNNQVLFFRDKNSVGGGNVLEFSIENSSAGTRVFDVTDLYNVKEVPVTVTGNVATGKAQADELHEYAAFNPGAEFPEPDFVAEVENQNLHEINTPEFLIVTHPNFLDAANALADFHRSYDGMSVEVVEAPKVYNEFSSGAKSATGIRNFIKMLYDRNEGLKYVLLFGDGSYDNKNVHPGSPAFIPTYQSAGSLNPTASFVTDDYFVLLDDNESVYSGAVDLGIGRIPASTVYQAQLVVDKVKNYYSDKALGNWRNVVCFIADDEDAGLHLIDSEKLANYINDNHSEFITDKIYFDAYMQETSSAVERYPGVTEAINKRVKDGVLILNYVGHANELFLADEQVLDVSNINSWSNYNSLPIFVTATCEFSRFDADEMSAGEYVLFNPGGGGIGLFSTTRLVYAYSNFLLSRSFYNVAFQQDENGDHYRMGDIMRLAKINTINTTNKRNFSLLADPALKLTYPKYKVITTSINQKDASTIADTIGALQKITVTGYISDHLNNKLDDFSGEIVPTVYDKAIMMKTLGNAGQPQKEFKVMENVIHKGRASVSNGEFTFSFVIPKDISYNLGAGKIVYYAQNHETDAHGAFDNFFIGGASSDEIADNEGPQIDLYLDSDEFVSGGQTTKNPVILASLSDENGINTIGTGIGHDITAVLDDDYSNIFVLNNFYQSNIDDYTGGTIQYPLKNLTAGKHTLKLKVWDVAGNSSEKEIEFVVSGNFDISAVNNYPNPVSDFTFFTFEHNQSDATMDAVFEIFDQNGRRIDYFAREVGSNGTASNPVRWSLTERNKSVRNGIYFYKITVQNTDGLIASKSGKFVVIH